jgi:RNA polymerase sigma-70 factor, ECF subfamily
MAPLAGQQSRSDRLFDRLYRRHVDDVYRYALAVLGNRADAEDVTQTAFLNAYRAYQNGQRAERPLNWLIAIAHNVCRQRSRELARRPSEVVLDRELAAASDDDGRRFRQEDISRALTQLSFKQRAGLAMRELEGRSYKEIAAVLGISDAAVETLLFRARRAFREQLEGSLTCTEAERAISRQLDGRLARSERADLRAHLRACPECASLARRFRAQRAALRRIAFLPLPQSLSSFSVAGGPALTGGAAVGTGLGIKAVTLCAAALVAAGVGTEVVRHSSTGSAPPTRHAAPSFGRLAPLRPPVVWRPTRAAAPVAIEQWSADAEKAVDRAARRRVPARQVQTKRHAPAATTSSSEAEPSPPRAPARVADPSAAAAAPISTGRENDSVHAGALPAAGASEHAHRSGKPAESGAVPSAEPKTGRAKKLKPSYGHGADDAGDGSEHPHPAHAGGALSSASDGPSAELPPAATAEPPAAPDEPPADVSGGPPADSPSSLDSQTPDHSQENADHVQEKAEHSEEKAEHSEEKADHAKENGATQGNQ